uniref:Putative LRR receptor-like serine/threonine-protein kinase n=1 Tax=Aegilops tauschii TaxID=37682 RepID=M8D001_AEGTA
MGGRGASWGVIRAAAVLALAVAVLGRVVASASSRAEHVTSRAEELEALMAIKAALHDPDGILGDWIVTAGRHRCRWTGVTCSVGRIDSLLLHHNSISGPIPDAIGGLPLLRHLSLSNNQLCGTIPDSLINSSSLFIMDLSFNNLSGTVQAFNIRNVLVSGNPLLRYPGCGGSCAASTVLQEEITVPALDPPTHPQSFAATIKIVVICVSTGSVGRDQGEGTNKVPKLDVFHSPSPANEPLLDNAPKSGPRRDYGIDGWRYVNTCFVDPCVLPKVC